ncbi:MAG TPA: cytochrome ubiquinol oxidase subunit I [Ideonella sp.]|uniref:cytochrome ubiquinol oxidase subunit I n=1 Tax=Ideonella sp. TaxID=1929293 RepID=UPI002E37A191|nr:cytochrome ubiquinol oxidase subunit I [Ideonella sp.]HEX5685268.1 cytochrome ubiquinol oxidase subunit I [Ideonella sp.]
MTIDAFVLSLMRLEFGAAASFHYLFVPLSLGLAMAVGLMEAAHWRTGRMVWVEAARFWRRFFLLAWFVGMVTGYPLRWQLQSHWQGYTEHVREVLGAVMTLEGWIAPLMLTLVAVLSLASHRLRPGTRVVLSGLLALAMATQAAGILTINAWMQHPVGVEFTDEGARLTSLYEVFASPFAHTKIAHTLSASVLTGAFFMLAVAGAYLLKRRHLPLARASMRAGLAMGLVGILATLHTGHESALEVAQQQPMKFAAMEAHWSNRAEEAPLVLWAWPDMDAQTNHAALELPGAMGWLVDGESPAGVQELTAQTKERIRLSLRPGASAELAVWRGLYQQAARRHQDVWPTLDDEARLALAASLSRPHVPTLFVAFRTMVGIGFGLLGVLLFAWRRRVALEGGLGGNRRLVVLLMACLPLPWIATLSGWMVAEVGRQPWVVYGQLLTAQAAVPAAAAGHPWAFVLRLVVYALLGGLFVRGCVGLWRCGPGPLAWWESAQRRLRWWLPLRRRAPLAACTSLLE